MICALVALLSACATTEDVAVEEVIEEGPAITQLWPVPVEHLCGIHDEIIRDLRRLYGEVLTEYGAGGGMKIEKYLNRKTGSFSILAVRPDGVACVLVSGDGWEKLSGV